MSFVLVLLVAIVGLIVIPYMNASYSAKPKTITESLDLNSVRDALMEKQGWSLERAEAARVEYVRFLTLLQMKPGFMLVPWTNAQGQDDLDQFWHQHILDTAKYASDCNRLFGRMIHHNPHVVRGSGQESDAMEKTQRLYARTFGSGSYGRPVDTIFLTGCGACATVDAHSSGDGGHGDSSHSCGGHSCGGHGCGGH
jgi:hypothetical protein